MAVMLHVCSEDAVGKIRRNGIRRSRIAEKRVGTAGVFAMPVTANFQYTHQWVRELMRTLQGSPWGVYFRVDDDEAVFLGHYANKAVRLPAAEASRLVEQGDGAGFEIIVPRRIEARHIFKARPMPRLVGWRHFPEAKGRAPCGCPSCQYGRFGARKLRAAHEAEGG